MPQVGTFDLASLRANRFTSVADFGEERLNEVIQADLEAHRQIVTEMMSDLCVQTTDRQRIYGGSSSNGTFQEVDEYSRVVTQKSYGGATLGFPLRLWQRGSGWTARAMAKMSVGEAAEMALDMQTADVRKRRAEIKRALFLSSNYTFRDELGVPVLDLAVKRLANADSMPIANSSDGAVFNASTHTHYSAINGLTATALTALINNVTEHGNGGRIVVAIQFNDETTVRGLTGFIPAPDSRVVPATTAAYTSQVQGNVASLYDRYIGVFGAAEVHVKPWAIQNYALAYDANAREKPLVLRVDDVASLVGLRLVSENTVYPLSTAHYEDSFGLGVWGRTSAAVLYFGGGSYTDPTITE